MKEIRHIISAYDQIDWTEDQAALATVVNVEQSSYRRIGARMLVLSSGQWVGGISGGCLEGDALRRARQAIINQYPSIITYDTTEEDDHQIGVGLGCQGKIDVLFTPLQADDADNPVEKLKQVIETRTPLVCYHDLTEGAIKKFYLPSDNEQLSQELNIDIHQLSSYCDKVIERHMSKVFQLENQSGESKTILFEIIIPRTHLVVYGDNYDIDAMLHVANELDWEVTLIGTLRKIRKSIYELADKVYSYEQLDKINYDTYTAAVLMTHDFDKDVSTLAHLLDKELSYIGILGPKARTIKLETETGFQLVGRENIYSPVGLDIGANTPEEIALAIAGEIIAHFRHRNGQSLRLRETTIYDRG